MLGRGPLSSPPPHATLTVPLPASSVTPMSASHWGRRRWASGTSMCPTPWSPFLAGMAGLGGPVALSPWGGTGLGGPGTERRCPGRAGGAPFPMSACPHADLSLCHQVPMPLGLHATGSPRHQVPIPHNSRSLCHWMPRSPGPRATKMSHTPCWWVPAPLGRHATKSLCHQVPVPMGPHSPCQGVPGPRPARPRG